VSLYTSNTKGAGSGAGTPVPLREQELYQYMIVETLVLVIQWDESKPILIGNDFCARNRQVIGLHMLH